MILCDDCRNKASEADAFSLRNWGGDTLYHICPDCRSYRFAFCVSMIRPGRLVIQREVERVKQYRCFADLKREVCDSTSNP